MHFSQVKILLVAAGAVHLTNAHTTFTNFFVDGVDQGDGTAVRMSNNIQQATYPLPNVTTPDMACGKLSVLSHAWQLLWDSFVLFL